tara:strand:+ start:1116 stop:1628 length:513 start_codon:yes stop_codon:yes gene_type:complete
MKDKKSQKKTQKKYYTTKNEEIKNLQDTIELLHNRHRADIQDIEIDNQKLIDKKDNEIKVLKEIVDEQEYLIDDTRESLHLLEIRRFSECKNIGDICNHLSPEDLRVLLTTCRKTLSFGIKGERKNDYEVNQLILAQLEDDRPDMPVIYTSEGVVNVVLERPVDYQPEVD